MRQHSTPIYNPRKVSSGKLDSNNIFIEDCGKLRMLVSKLKSAYQYYVYSSPIPVLSKEETIIFNAINVLLLLFGLYWAMTILPILVIKSMESLCYYVTGHSVSANLILSFIISRNFWIKCGFQDILTRNKTTTEI